MRAGHIGLPEDLWDLIISENQLYSGVYTLEEHYYHIPSRSYPVTSVYDDFKEFGKYNYNQSEELQLITITNPPYDTIKINGIGIENQTDNKQFISFTLFSLQNAFLTFYLYNPNNQLRLRLQEVIRECYELRINNQKINLLDYYINNPQLYNELFSYFKIDLINNKTYKIEFIFNSHILHCIQQQTLLLTGLQYPTKE
jgi:hypothetical protein